MAGASLDWTRFEALLLGEPTELKGLSQRLVAKRIQKLLEVLHDPLFKVWVPDSLPVLRGAFPGFDWRFWQMPALLGSDFGGYNWSELQKLVASSDFIWPVHGHDGLYRKFVSARRRDCESEPLRLWGQCSFAELRQVASWSFVGDLEEVGVQEIL